MERLRKALGVRSCLREQRGNFISASVNAEELRQQMATDTKSKEGSKNSVSVKALCYQASPAVLWGGSVRGGTAGGRTRQRLGMS